MNKRLLWLLLLSLLLSCRCRCYCCCCCLFFYYCRLFTHLLLCYRTIITLVFVRRFVFFLLSSRQVEMSAAGSTSTPSMLQNSSGSIGSTSVSSLNSGVGGVGVLVHSASNITLSPAKPRICVQFVDPKLAFDASPRFRNGLSALEESAERFAESMRKIHALSKRCVEIERRMFGRRCC